MFLIPLDDERRWYRHQHLFGEVVRARLQQGASSEQIAELHRRASAWHEREGSETEAVYHALAAADWERVMRLLVPNSPKVVGRSQFHTGLSWLSALAEAVIRTNPTLCMYHAAVLMYMNQVEKSESRLRDADRGLEDGFPVGRTPEEARVIQGQVAVIRAAVARIRGNRLRCVELSYEALDLLPDPETTPLKLRPLARPNA